MYDVINNLYYLIVSLQMGTGKERDRSNNISVSIGLQNVIDRYGTDQRSDIMETEKRSDIMET